MKLEDEGSEATADREGRIEAIIEVIRHQEGRGFEPVLIAFKSRRGDVELVRHGIDLRHFLEWLLDRWVPNVVERPARTGRMH